MFRKDPFSFTGLARSGSSNIFQLPGGRLGGGASLLGQAQQPAAAVQPRPQLTPAGESPLVNRQQVLTVPKLAVGPFGMGADPEQQAQSIGNAFGRAFGLQPPLDGMLNHGVPKPAPVPGVPQVKTPSPTANLPSVTKPFQPRSMPQPAFQDDPRPLPQRPTLIDFAARNPPPPAPSGPPGPGPGGRHLSPAPIPVPPTASEPAPLPPVPAPAPLPASKPAVPMSSPAPPAHTPSAAPDKPLVGAPPPVLAGRFQPYIDQGEQFIARQQAELSNPALSAFRRRRMMETIKQRAAYISSLRKRQEMSPTEQLAAAPTPAAQRQVSLNNLAGGRNEQYQLQANDYARSGKLNPLATYRTGAPAPAAAPPLATRESDKATLPPQAFNDPYRVRAPKAAGYANDLDDELRLVGRYTTLRRGSSKRVSKKLKDVAASESLLAIEKASELSDMAKGFLRTCLLNDYDPAEMAKRASEQFPELSDELEAIKSGRWGSFLNSADAASSAGRLAGQTTDTVGEAARSLGQGAAKAAPTGAPHAPDAKDFVSALDDARANTAGAGGAAGAAGASPAGGQSAWFQAGRMTRHLGQGLGRAARGAFSGLGIPGTMWPLALAAPQTAMLTVPGGMLAGAVRGSKWFDNLAGKFPGTVGRAAKAYDYINSPAIHGGLMPLSLGPGYAGLSAPQKALARMNQAGDVVALGATAYQAGNLPFSFANTHEQTAYQEATGRPGVEVWNQPGKQPGSLRQYLVDSAAGLAGVDLPQVRADADKLHQAAEMVPTSMTDLANKLGLGEQLAAWTGAPDIMSGLSAVWQSLGPDKQRWLLGSVGMGVGLLLVLAGLAGGSNALAGIGGLFGLGSATYASGIIQELMKQPATAPAAPGAPAPMDTSMAPAALPESPALPAPGGFSTLPVSPGRELALASGQA